MASPRPSLSLVILGALLVVVSMPLDGIVSIGLALAGGACAVTFLARHSKSGGA